MLMPKLARKCNVVTDNKASDAVNFAKKIGTSKVLNVYADERSQSQTRLLVLESGVNKPLPVNQSYLHRERSPSQ